MAPWICASNSNSIMFKLLMQNSCVGIRCAIALRWMPQRFTRDINMSRLMNWRRQPASHYLSYCCPNPCRHIASQSHKELNVKCINAHSCKYSTSWALYMQFLFRSPWCSQVVNNLPIILHTYFILGQAYCCTNLSSVMGTTVYNIGEIAGTHWNMLATKHSDTICIS